MTLDIIELDRFAFKCLVSAVCKYCELTPEELLGKSRLKKFVTPRHILFYMAYVYTGYSFPQIAKKSERDHTTVLYAYNKIAKDRLKNDDIDLAISEIHLIATLNEKKRREKVKEQRAEVQKMIDNIGGNYGLRVTPK